MRSMTQKIWSAILLMELRQLFCPTCVERFQGIPLELIDKVTDEKFIEIFNQQRLSLIKYDRPNKKIVFGCRNCNARITL